LAVESKLGVWFGGVDEASRHQLLLRVDVLRVKRWCEMALSDLRGLKMHVNGCTAPSETPRDGFPTRDKKAEGLESDWNVKGLAGTCTWLV
jgi:hypothetical protein